ncbi:cysteine desulfurase family protein [Brevundimonas sp.]|uniref:cysteine desulfurase family protein n=1 Tax=Brevundimonas sp. TaxID=1871086 RepID=UPI003D6C76B4
MTASPIFLDYHAHGPLDPEVAQVLTAAFAEFDVNPHSGSLAAERARIAVEAARAEVAALVRVPPSSLIFTSGATEANNLVFAGLAAALQAAGRPRIIVSAIEHPSVLAAADRLGDQFDVQRAPVRRDGLIDLEALERLATPQTGLISVAAANHEIGVVQPLASIVTLARKCGAFFHTDAAQAAGKIALDLSEVDLASLSAHKLHGPFGIGALHARRPVQKQLQPLLVGGAQEKGLRSGTAPVPLCVAFGAAARLADQARQENALRVGALRDRLLKGLLAIGDVTLNGDVQRRLPGNLNLCFAGVDAEALVMRLRADVVISTGSACTSASLEPSPVLQALGLERQVAETAVRLGLGRFTTQAEVETAIVRITKAVAELRAVGQRAVA